jgi:polysaccharide deacetylase
MLRPPFRERGGALRGVVDLATGCYPSFLFGGSLGGALPVFHFHDVTREWLEPRLQYLVENGYRTVTCDEIARLVVDGTALGPRTVGLTFDDAWASARSVATPLLKQYRLNAILFAIPGRVHDRPNIGADPNARPDDPFVTWEQLREMHASGVWDIQSHTRSHAMIFTDSEAIGFVTPDYARQPLLGRPLTTIDGHVTFLRPEALGTPLYLQRSRMADGRRYLSDEHAGARCRDHVARNGGARFFERPGWLQELHAIADDEGTEIETFESNDEREAAIRTELADGRALLNEQLGSTTVRHVALPWGIAGETTRRALAATGHELAFAERPLRSRVVRAGDDRYELMRLNGKFLTCLPGRGRQWFFSTVRRRL